MEGELVFIKTEVLGVFTAMNESDFRVEIASDVDFEDFVADIYYDNECIAMLSQEQGFDKLEIEIYPSKEKNTWKFRYSEFEKVLSYAKQRLWELRKLSEE